MAAPINVTEGGARLDTHRVMPASQWLPDDELAQHLPSRIKTRRGLLSRLWIGLQIAVLWMQIKLTEDWLADCARDGLHESLALTEFRADLGRMRCRVAYLESL